jgi:hypothetical protein
MSMECSIYRWTAGEYATLQILFYVKSLLTSMKKWIRLLSSVIKNTEPFIDKIALSSYKHFLNLTPRMK